MCSHVPRTCKSAFLLPSQYKAQYKYLNQESTERLIHAFFISRLDYCNSLLYAITSNSAEKLRRVQKTAVRVVYRAPTICHITPMLFGLLGYRLGLELYFISLLLFSRLSIIRCRIPFNLITFNKGLCSMWDLTISILLSPPSVKTRLGDIAFEAAAPKLWNDLPHDIRITGDFTSFKQKLKRVLFKRAYQLEVVIFIFYFICYYHFIVSLNTSFYPII